MNVLTLLYKHNIIILLRYHLSADRQGPQDHDIDLAVAVHYYNNNASSYVIYYHAHTRAHTYYIVIQGEWYARSSVLSARGPWEMGKPPCTMV